MYTLLKHKMPVLKIHTSIQLHWLKTSMVSFNGEFHDLNMRRSF